MAHLNENQQRRFDSHLSLLESDAESLDAALRHQTDPHLDTLREILLEIADLGTRMPDTHP